MVADRPNVILVTSVLPGQRAQQDSNRDLATRCLEGRFTQRVNLLVLWSEPVGSCCGYSSMFLVSAPFWHAAGTGHTVLGLVTTRLISWLNTQRWLRCWSWPYPAQAGGISRSDIRRKLVSQPTCHLT